uniref:Putative prophenoloxidase n=1 Tax=Artemia franciscana TaxID=6661 RepID=A7WPD2_ARTSF|nr:putative prophenoloxidase [Artemia franciscana]
MAGRNINSQEKLFLLLETPSEPVFKPKKYKNEEVYIDVPDKYLQGGFKDLKPILTGGIGLRDGRPGKVPSPLSVRGVELPDLSPVLTVPRGRPWSVFYDVDKKAGNALVKMMNTFKNIDDLFSFAALVRDRVNEEMFVYAVMATVFRRPELQASAIKMNNIFELFPDRIIGSDAIAKAKETIKQSTGDEDEETVLEINQEFSALDKNPENRLAYFREDLGVNSHHWHWHLVFPDDEEFKRDRRGEMFFYMHHQIIARYDCERLSNGLPLVRSFHKLDEPIEEAYFSKLTTDNSGKLWGVRPAGMKIQDMELPEPNENYRIMDMEGWRDRIRDAIHRGIARRTDGTEVRLDAKTGIDILGDMIEPALSFSVNPRFYGQLHNKGHVLIGHCHDPTGANKENGGPMTDSMTAMRDPIFYRWHKHIDELFYEFKETLGAYTKDELGFRGITVMDVSVSNGNRITTGWGKSRLNLAQGIDLQGRRNVQAELTHLIHEPFAYRFTVRNDTRAPRRVCFRVFMTPIYDEVGRKLTFRQQTLLAVEMDKFAVTVNAPMVQLDRTSRESSVTIPIERFFRVYERRTANTSDALSNYEMFCGCGWPEHMLVPKGSAEGMQFELIVIATDWSKDEVPVKTTNKPCSRGTSYCGVLDDKYPDKRPMGFPFDRPIEDATTTYEDFTEGLTNIFKREVVVQFKDEVLLNINRL